jgi:hypothetical protein
MPLPRGLVSKVPSMTRWASILSLKFSIVGSAHQQRKGPMTVHGITFHQHAHRDPDVGPGAAVWACCSSDDVSSQDVKAAARRRLQTSP